MGLAKDDHIKAWLEKHKGKKNKVLQCVYSYSDIQRELTQNLSYRDIPELYFMMNMFLAFMLSPCWVKLTESIVPLV